MEKVFNLKLEGIEILEKIPTVSLRDLYIANSPKINKKVMVKNVTSNDELDSSVINLRNEYEIIKYLEGSIELKVYEVQNHSSGYALIMDYFEGSSLKDIIKEHPMDMDNFFRVAISLAEKIQKVHHKKVIHKDIKPDNIIINPDTNEVQLIDFGISTRLSKQESSWSSPNVLEGSIPYISPEQTGRMNRSIDYRTDFYSIGITYYEMLLGRLPFTSEDPLEIIHSHLAKIPESPTSIRPEVPEVVSKIVLKLLSKRAEERYLSCKALINDLQKCYDEWKKSGKVENFEIGEFDFTEDFKIPQKLYGRQKEVDLLLEEFKLTSQTGRSKLFLVSGYSGIGKTSLVREIYKPITESKGHYISGKFDQYNRNMPYSALIQALTGLIKFILTEPPESIKSWKGKILESLGSNGKIITDVIPELEYIIGEQPEVVELSAQENANRFYVVFQNFIKIFTNINHPLAIFLDDLQWADNSSIDFIKTLLTDPSVKYLFLILSYRDNEIDKVHPLFQFIESLSTDSIPYEQIVLQPLQSEFLEEMLAETFLTSKDKVRSFTEIVHSKTGGNPFFVSELLKQLISDDLIHFSSSKGGWIWDEEKIKKSEVSDNVIELLLKRIKKLGETSQNILKFSSCIGSIFDLDTLHKIVDDQSNSFINSLKDTIQEELVQPLGESFKFLESLNSKNSKKKIKLNFRFQHDRIQQACYNLLEEVQKQETHLVIARILVEKSTEKDIDDVIFDIVSHYNQCYELLTDKKELENLIDFNLKAAKKAKQSSAYIPALEMIHVARKISEKVKVSSDKLTNLYIELAELEYLNGNLDESETYCMKALEHTDDVIIKAKIRDLLITQYSAKGMYDKALESINLALEPLGMHLPSENLMDIISEDMNTVLKMIEGKKVKSLINLPFMEDPKIKAAANIFISAIPTAYNKIPELFPVISLKMVKLHLNHGNLGDSYGFSMFGIVLQSGGSFEQAYDFCDLAVNISEKYNNPSGVTKASNILANYATPFVRHIKNSEEINGKCIRASLDSGEFLHGSYGAMNDAINIFYQGKRLESIKDKLETLYSYTRKVKSNLAIDTVEGARLIIPNLLGKTESHLTFNSDSLTEQEFIELCNSHQSLFPVCLFKIMKARALLIYNEPKMALKELDEAEPMLAFIAGQYSIIEHNFCTSLALTQLYKSYSVEERKSILVRIKENQKKLKSLSTSCTENFMHKYLLIEAELARLTYKNWKAAKFYDNAIIEARKNDFIQNEANFLEIAARFWISKNNNKIASQYIQEAFQRYKVWGAERKCEMLLTKFSDFLSESKKISNTTSRPGNASQTELYSGQTLDIQSVFKSSNAISSEIKLENLFGKLLQILIENAGAEKGVLLLKKEKGISIEAVGNVNKEAVEILTDTTIDNYSDIPKSLIYYVARTKDNLVISNGSNDERFRTDSYIQKNNTKSILCSPILKQGEINGLLYLENNLTEGAFTSDRLQVVNMLSSQAAISLDNAQLYNNLEEKVKERTRQLALLNEELEEKNLHITDSIKYAQNIQFAILPAWSELTSNYTDIFVLYSPKDIVSGDFYWFTETKNAKIIAAVDCTGHGVPGALMSMIGNTILNQIVNEKNISDPGKILTLLNQEVRSVLRQDLEETNSTDGMDLCICKIEGDTLYYAGAKRPVYFVTNGELEENKCDRYSIGGRQSGEKEFKTFTREIDKSKRTMVYLTTDGYADQPNEDRTKIGSRNLQALFREIGHLNCDKQKEKLLAHLENHSAGQPQRDDITIIGFTP